MPILIGAWGAAPFHSFVGAVGLLAAGTVVGLTLFSAIAFALALHFGVSWLTILLALAMFAVLAAVMRLSLRPQPLKVEFRKGGRIERWVTGIGLAALTMLILKCFTEVLLTKSDGLYVGFEKNLGDLPLHLHFAA